MIDTAGSFDPRSFLKKKAPDAMNNPMSSGGGITPTVPFGMGGGGNTPGFVDPKTPPIPNVAPYQPIGGGIIPTVPFGGGTNTNLPPMAPDDVMQGGRANNAPVAASPVPNVPPPNVAPQAPVSNVPQQTQASPVPNYTGNAGKSSAEINDYLAKLSGSVDPRLNYGYNPGQWGINKNVENVMTNNLRINNNGKEPSPEEVRQYILQTKRNNPNSNSTAQPWVENLPDEQEYMAHQAKMLAPYNESVASERAAGRPGHSGEVDLPQYADWRAQQAPNYVNPSSPPPNIASQNPTFNQPILDTAESMNQVQGFPTPTQPILDTAESMPNIALQRPEDRWLGTQRRTPNYF